VFTLKLADRIDMGLIQEIFDKTMDAAPRTALSIWLKKKLSAEGLKHTDELVDAIVEHLLTKSAEPFAWDDGDDRDISIEFTDKDAAELAEAIDRLIASIPALVETTSENIADKLLHDLKSKWKAERKLQIRDRKGFQSRLEARWGKALDLLRMMVTIAREFGGDSAKAGELSQDHFLRNKQLVLRLHVRACHVASEIICLLDNGYADGAMARWRTLHEIGVVAALLEMAGGDTAERYVAFSAIEAKRGLQEYLNCQDELGYEPFPAETIDRINEKFDAAIERYGKPFGTPYGWAAHYLKKDKPTFSDIEKAVDRDWQRSHYKMASYNVHAGPHAAYFRLGLMAGTEGYLAGPSNAGLHEPGQNTGYTLAQISAVVIGKSPSMDQLVAVQVLEKLAREIPREFAEAEEQLKKDHAKFVGKEKP
jgi:hypothetical protein